MLATVAIVVYTHNLALGVGAGVLLSALFFANKIGRLMTVQSLPTGRDESLAYGVLGQVFFASADRFVGQFEFRPQVRSVSIDVSHAHFWDVTAISALDKVVLKYRKMGADVEVFGLNEASQTLVDKFGQHDKTEDVDVIFKH
ncbi:STAS domain-containing protein, partial [Moraxella sp.]|uniref:STAS domain-containing protein n=1 Tax=Moraxella sp. TaxID=479 RepID=UPI00262B4507